MQCELRREGKSSIIGATRGNEQQASGFDQGLCQEPALGVVRCLDLCPKMPSQTVGWASPLRHFRGPSAGQSARRPITVRGSPAELAVPEKPLPPLHFWLLH